MDAGVADAGAEGEKERRRGAVTGDEKRMAPARDL